MRGAAVGCDNFNLIEVETIRISKFLNRKVHFLKIDIEGAENNVIPEIENKLHNVENIFVEYHSLKGAEQMLPEILAILKAAGFRLNIQLIWVYSPNPFISILDYNNIDLQLNIFGYRL